MNVTPEVSLDKLLDTGQDDHLVCSCRPQFTLCGQYDANSTSVVYDVSSDKDCAECMKVWQSTGCGVCRCHATWSCGPCRSRYYASLAH